jgi:hypothetical protein
VGGGVGGGGGGGVWWGVLVRVSVGWRGGGDLDGARGLAVALLLEVGEQLHGVVNAGTHL